MATGLFEQFVTLFVVVDPIGTVPVFVAVTAGVEPSLRRRVAFRAFLIALGVLAFFLVAGQFLIEGLGISLPAFQIAGGLILFLFALTMIFGESKPDRELAEADRSAEAMSKAVFPLAVPSIASPGAMLAVVLLTENNVFSVAEQAVTAGVLVVVLLIALLAMLAAGPILRLVQESGAAIVSRVMGMILAAVAVDNIIAAVFVLIAEGPV